MAGLELSVLLLVVLLPCSPVLSKLADANAILAQRTVLLETEVKERAAADA